MPQIFSNMIVVNLNFFFFFNLELLFPDQNIGRAEINKPIDGKAALVETGAGYSASPPSRNEW